MFTRIETYTLDKDERGRGGREGGRKGGEGCEK